MHVGFIAMMDLTRNTKISFQPMLANYGYKYKTEYQWQGNTNLHYLTQYHQNIRMYEFPIMVGYYFRAQTWRPYVQGGTYYAFVSSSNTAVSVTEATTSGGGTNSIVEYSSSVSSSSLYQKHHIGVLGGGGIQFLGERIHIGLEANYRFLFTKLNTTESRYSNNQVVSGYNDVADDIRFSNVAITLNMIVPIQSRRKSSLPFCDY